MEEAHSEAGMIFCGAVRFCRHMTTIHVALTCLPFWMCDNQGDNVGVSEKCHTGLATSLQLSGNQKKKEYFSSGSECLLEVNGSHWENDC